MSLFTPRLSEQEKEEKAAAKAARVKRHVEKYGSRVRRREDGYVEEEVTKARKPYIPEGTRAAAEKVLEGATSDHYIIPTLGSSKQPRITINEGVEGVAREIMNSTNARPMKNLGETINRALEKKNRSSSNRRHSFSDESDATEVPPDYDAVPRPRSHSRESRSSTPQGIRGDEDDERRARNRGGGSRQGDGDEDIVKRPDLQLDDTTIMDDGKSVSGSTRDGSKSGSRHKGKSRSHQSDQKVQKHRERTGRPPSPTGSDKTFHTARSDATYHTAVSARRHQTRTITSRKEQKDPDRRRSTRQSSPTPSTASTVTTVTNRSTKDRRDKTVKNGGSSTGGRRGSTVSSSSLNKSSREPTEAEIALEEAESKLRDAKKAFKSKQNDETRDELRACRDKLAEAEQQLAQEQVGAMAQMDIQEEEDFTDDTVPVSPSEASSHSAKSRDSSFRAKRPPPSVITSASLAPSEWDRASPDELEKQLKKAKAELREARKQLDGKKNSKTLQKNVG
ncbi:hypothetical protein ACMFMF_010083 [Clarireedia jacksonii]